MASKTIPATKITTCDCCGVECSSSNRKQEAVLSIQQHALDFHGDPVANGSVEFDLCDTCLGFINGALNMEMNRIRIRKDQLDVPPP